MAPSAVVPGLQWISVHVSNSCGSIGTDPQAHTYISGNCSQYKLTLSPNPAKQRLKVELIEQGPSSRVIDKVEILSDVGELLRATVQSAKMIEVDLNDLPRGIKYARVQIGEEISTIRLILE